MKKRRLVPLASLGFLIACAQPVQPPIQVVTRPLLTPLVRHSPATGCKAEHDTFYLHDVSIDAYPSLPPKAEPDHVVLYFSDGTTIWAKPQYGSADCTDYLNCRSATLVMNPIWNQCKPKGIFYEVATEDGGQVFGSSSWAITEPDSRATVHVNFACGHGFAGQDFTTVSNRALQSGCLSQARASERTVTLPAAIAIGVDYFRYRAAYNRPVECVSNDSSSSTWSTSCY